MADLQVSWSGWLRKRKSDFPEFNAYLISFKKTFSSPAFPKAGFFLPRNSGLLDPVKTSTDEGFHSESVVVISIGLLSILWTGQALATANNRSV